MKQPEITVIVSCSSITKQVKSFLDHVAKTQPVSKIELFLVAWDGYDYLALATAPFGAKYQINFSPNAALSEARAKAVSMATAKIVVFLEDHVRVEGHWVDTLIRIFDDGKYSAVGWTFKPGDVVSKVSWTGFLMEYACWGPGLAKGEAADHLPGHNCAYTLETLLSQGAELASLLRAESILHWRLLKQGKKLFFTTDIALVHWHFLSMSKMLKGNFWYGWNFADTKQKSERWSLLRRWFYAGAIFLKPLVRWKVLLSTPRDKTFYPPGILWKLSLNVTLGYVVASLGEAMGHVFGTWKAPVILAHYELGFDRNQR